MSSLTAPSPDEQPGEPVELTEEPESTENVVESSAEETEPHEVGPEMEPHEVGAEMEPREVGPEMEPHENDAVDEQCEDEFAELDELVKNNIISVRRTREKAATNLFAQAERMVKRARIDLKEGEIGDNIALPIPAVDRGRGDPRNIIGLILDRDENDLYTIAVKSGVLKGKYSRNQFSLLPQALLCLDKVNTENTIPLREAVKSLSQGGGQGYTKCNCAKGNKQCQTNRCKCFKNGLKCNSRCHNSLNCKNK